MTKEKIEGRVLNFDRSIFIGQDKRQNILKDLYQVGVNKPVGFLKIADFKKGGLSVETVKAELAKKGVEVLELSEEESHIMGGAIYAYDIAALGQLLQTNEAVLKKFGWPTKPDEFIFYLKNQAPDQTLLYNIITDAFGYSHDHRRLKEKRN